jgi:hypothetical protein
MLVYHVSELTGKALICGVGPVGGLRGFGAVVVSRGPGVDWGFAYFGVGIGAIRVIVRS